MNSIDMTKIGVFTHELINVIEPKIQELFNQDKDDPKVKGHDEYMKLSVAKKYLEERVKFVNES